MHTPADPVSLRLSNALLAQARDANPTQRWLLFGNTGRSNVSAPR